MDKVKKTLKQRAEVWIEGQYHKDDDFEICDECEIGVMAWKAGYRTGKRDELIKLRKALARAKLIKAFSPFGSKREREGLAK